MAVKLACIITKNLTSGLGQKSGRMEKNTRVHVQADPLRTPNIVPGARTGRAGGARHPTLAAQELPLFSEKTPDGLPQLYI